MRLLVQIFKRNRLLVVSLGLVFFLNIGLWIAVSLFPSDGTPLVLHFRSRAGADLLGERKTLQVIPGIGLVVGSLNAFLASFFRQKDHMGTYALVIGAVIVQVFLALALLALVVVNRVGGF